MILITFSILVPFAIVVMFYYFPSVLCCDKVSHKVIFHPLSGLISSATMVFVHWFFIYLLYQSAKTTEGMGKGEDYGKVRRETIGRGRSPRGGGR